MKENDWIKIEDMPEEWKVEGKEFLIYKGESATSGYKELPKSTKLINHPQKAYYLVNDRDLDKHPYKAWEVPRYPGYNFCDVQIPTGWKDEQFYKPDFIRLPIVFNPEDLP